MFMHRQKYIHFIMMKLHAPVLHERKTYSERKREATQGFVKALISK